MARRVQARVEEARPAVYVLRCGAVLEGERCCGLGGGEEAQVED